MDRVELVLFFLLACIAALTAAARLTVSPFRSCSWSAAASSASLPACRTSSSTRDLVLLIFLPPLPFNTAYFSSVRDLRENVRTTPLSAVGLVLGGEEWTRDDTVERMLGLTSVPPSAPRTAGRGRR